MRTVKGQIVDALSDYFAMKGQVFTAREYVKQSDKPAYGVRIIKRYCTSWSRLISLCEKNFPERMAIARGDGTPYVTVVGSFNEIPEEKPPITAAEAFRRIRE